MPLSTPVRLRLLAAASALFVGAALVTPLSASAVVVPFGSVAGDSSLPQCTATTLPTDQTQTSVLALPVPIRLYGQRSTGVEVHASGYLQLIDASGTAHGLISPGAMTASRAGSSGPITYGVGADGVFCAVWNSVANSAAAGAPNNTFQVIIRPQTGQIGHADGDATITLNYDSLQHGAFGSDSMYSNIRIDPLDGVTAHTIVIDPPGTQASYRDGGANAMITHSRDSSQPGRYVFEYLNDGPKTLGTLTAPVPTLVGNSTVGSTVAAVSGTWGPAPVDLAFQWRRDGTSIAGATNPIYVITSDDVGHAVTVAVTGTKADYATATTTGSALNVAPLWVDIPTITGKAARGSTLSAFVVSSAPVAFQWLRDGVPIAGAAGSTYKLVKADDGRRISVTASVSQAGYSTVSASSAVTERVTKPFAHTAKGVIKGTVKVGHRLRVATGTWKPKPRFTYRWYADEKPIAKATKSTFTVTKAVKGKKISVRATARKTGYTTRITTSASKRVK